MLKIPLALVLMIFNSFGSLYAMDICNAAWYECTQKVKQLIHQNNALVNARSYFNRTSLQKASWQGHTKIADFLLQHNADPNTQDDWKATPLHHASHQGHTKIAALLLQHNVNVNAQDYKKWTPLHQASYKGHTNTIKLLLSYGATPHKPINLFVKCPRHSQRYAQRYESWLGKTFVSRKNITFLLSLIGRQKATDIPLLPKDMRNLIARYALADEVQEWEQFKKENPDVAVLARIELP